MDVHLCQINGKPKRHFLCLRSVPAELTRMHPDSDVNKPFLMPVKQEMFEALRVTHSAEVKSV